MPVYTLTARILDASGQVRAVRRRPFLVLDPAEELEKAALELEIAAAALEAAAADLEAAAHDEHHRYHHWWLP